MKKITLILAILFGMAIVFSSCSKYEDGPAFSLKSKEKRVAGEYTVDKVLKNGQEDEAMTEEQEGVTYTFKDDGTGDVLYSGDLFGTPVSIEVEMEWKFNDDKTKISVRMKDFTTDEWQDWEESTILKLEDEEIWVEAYNDYDDLIETHFKE